jgi:hypothetical protein
VKPEKVGAADCIKMTAFYLSWRFAFLLLRKKESLRFRCELDARRRKNVKAECKKSLMILPK